MTTKKLSELCSLIVDCPHSTPVWTDEGKIVIRNFNIKDGIIDFSKPSYTDDYHFTQRVKRAVPQAKDVVITREAPMGEVGMIPEGMECCLGQRMVLLRANEKICDPYYLLYVLQTDYVQHQISWSKGTGTTVSNLRIPHLEALDIPFVNIDLQRELVMPLVLLDEKQDVNKAINDNLEKQINSILLHALSISDTDDVKLGEYLYIKGRIGWKGLKKKEYLEHSNFRIINGESLTKAGIDWDKAGYISEERYEESPEIMLKEEDILLSKDGTIGKIGFIYALDMPTAVASGIFVIRNIQPEVISTPFVYYLLKSELFMSFIEERTEGSVIPHLYQKDFMEFEFPLPEKKTMKWFDDNVKPMFSTIMDNLQENERLKAIKKTLLPKLLSGSEEKVSIDI